MPDINLGSDYELDQDSNGDLVIKHSSNGTVMRYDASADQWVSVAPFDDVTTPQITDSETNIVYDVGDDLAQSGLTTKVVDSASTTSYTTSDEDVIYVDTGSAAVTITLASSDATLGNEVQVVNVTGTNAVTVNTESSETIDPNGDSSKTITKQGWSVGFVSDGSDWDSSLEGEYESVSTDNAVINSNEVFVQGTQPSMTDGDVWIDNEP
jgi:hypothetical protein